MTPQELQQYIAQFNSAVTSGGAQRAVQQYQSSGNYDTLFGQGMNTAWQNSPLQAALQTPEVTLPNFFNSSAYKLQYGDSPTAKSLDPSVRFQNDPGVQAMIKSAMPSLANIYSNKGLGASGKAAAGIADYMTSKYADYLGSQQNLYQNEFSKAANTQQQAIGTYLNQQGLMNQSFTNYQNQLAQLGQLNGTNLTTTQAQQQFTASQNLAQLLAQLNNATGGALATGQMNASAIISQLLANQGVLNANAFLSTGAGMSGNILAGSQLGAQLQNAQNQTNAATTNSLLAGGGQSGGGTGGGQGSMGGYF